MQAMPPIQGMACAGATLVVGTGLALYQLTSLVLGPVSSRQLDMSLTIPAVEAQDLSEPMPANVTVVVGVHATPAAPAPSATRVEGSARAAGATARKAASPSQPLPTPSSLAAERQVGRPHAGPSKLPVDD